MSVTTVALPDDMHRRLLIAAVEHRIAFTEIVRQALADWLSKHEKKKGRTR
jgi:predicted transcriptional regulator